MFDIHKREPMEIYLVGAGFLHIGVFGDEPDSAEGDAADRRNRKAGWQSAGSRRNRKGPSLRVPYA